MSACQELGLAKELPHRGMSNCYNSEFDSIDGCKVDALVKTYEKSILLYANYSKTNLTTNLFIYLTSLRILEGGVSYYL